MTMTNEQMRDHELSHSNAIAERSADAFARFFRAFDGKSLFNANMRSLDSFSKMSCKLGSATAEIGEKQLAMIRTFAMFPEQSASDRFSGRNGELDLRGRSMLQAAAEQMRDINEIMRDCWSQIAQEAEACARDHFMALGDNLRAAGGNLQQGLQQTAEAGRAAGEYGAEAMRRAGDSGAISIRRGADAAGKVGGEVADAARKMGDATSKQNKTGAAE